MPLALRLLRGAAMEITNGVILDTDLDSDIDDVADLLFAGGLADQRLITLLAVTICSANVYAAPCAQAMLDYLGQTQTVVGAYKGSASTAGASTSDYTQGVRDRFKAGQTRADYADAVRVMRQALVKCANGTAQIIFTGTALNVGALLASSADDVSPLTGAQLCAAKVKRIIGVAGYFNGTATQDAANAAPDLTSINAICTSGLPVVWCGLELGDGGLKARIDSQSDPTIDPFKYAWNLGAINQDSAGYRTDWSAPAFYLAAGDPRSYFALSGLGDAAFTAGSPYQTFTLNASGKSRYITRVAALNAVNDDSEDIRYWTTLAHTSAYQSTGYVSRLRAELLMDAGAGASTQVVTDNSGRSNAVRGADSAAASDDPTWVATGLDFDGTNDIVTIPGISDNTSNGIFVVAVVNPDTIVGSDQIVTRGDSAANQFQLRLQDGVLQYVNQVTPDVIAAPSPVTAGSWVILSWQIDEKRIKLRQAGSEVTRSTLTLAPATSSLSFMVGSRASSGGFFDGRMAYLAIYVRSAAADIPTIEARARAAVALKGITV